jgi:manganese/iron transport system permease protein
MDSLINLLYTQFILPLETGLMQRAVIAAILIGIVSGVMGAYIVTRGLAFLGDALSHSILPGVALAALHSAGDSTLQMLGGLTAGVLSALGIGLLTRGRRMQEDTAIGIVFAGMLALGIGIISSSRNTFATDLQHALVGNILSVTSDDLTLMIIMSVVVLVIVVLLYKEFLLISFDPGLAQTLRLPAETLRILLLVLMAVTIIIGVQAVGIAMISATLITPAATSRLFTNQLWRMMMLSAAIGSTCGVIGMYVSWHSGLAPSATIVMLMTGTFALAFLFAPNKGYVWSLLGKSARRA